MVGQRVAGTEGQAVAQRARGRRERQRITFANAWQLLRQAGAIAALLQGVHVAGEILLVAAQSLVGPLPVQQHRHPVLAGQAKDIPLCVLAGTAHRQLVVPDKRRQLAHEAVHRRLHHVAVHAGGLDHLRGIGPLVGRGAGKAAGEGVVVRILAQQLAGDADDGAGIQAAGQTRAHRHVAAHAQPHRIHQQLTEMREHFAFIRNRRSSAGLQRPVVPDPPLQGVDIHLHRLARQQLLDIVEHGLAITIQASTLVVRGTHQTQFVVIQRQSGMLQQRLVLGGEGKKCSVATKQKWLFPIAITGTKQHPARAVVQGKGEHAVEALQTIRTPALVGLQQHLGVGMGAEHHPSRDQLGAHLQVVVDLTVVSQDEITTGIGHRLRAGLGQVQDGQAAVAKTHRPARRQCSLPVTMSVRPAVDLRVQHRIEDGGACALTDDSRNPAHQLPPLLAATVR